LVRLQLPQVDLGVVALSVPKETLDKGLEEAKDTVAPLVAIAMSIVDDRMLLFDEYPDEGDAPVGPQASP
jgi:hypothetical protein